MQGNRSNRDEIEVQRTPASPVTLPIHQQEVPTVCSMLRSRGGWDAQADGIDWRHGTSTTATFWCLGTMESTGPDDHFAHAEICRRGRRCFCPPKT